MFCIGNLWSLSQLFSSAFIGPKKSDYLQTDGYGRVPIRLYLLTLNLESHIIVTHHKRGSFFLCFPQPFKNVKTSLNSQAVQKAEGLRDLASDFSLMIPGPQPLRLAMSESLLGWALLGQLRFCSPILILRRIFLYIGEECLECWWLLYF